MAKDPAILWYWNDWNGGTMTLSRHDKGCYMDLLSAQYNSGPLSLDQIKTVLGTDKARWDILSKKFRREVNSDNVEVFFNERMETEKIKRANFSKKQSERVSKRYNKSTMVDSVVIPLLENENRNEIIIQEKVSEIINSLVWIEQIAMKYNKTFYEISFHLNEFLGELRLKDDLHKSIKEIKSHFINWLKIKLKNATGTNKQQSAIEGFVGGQ